MGITKILGVTCCSIAIFSLVACGGEGAGAAGSTQTGNGGTQQPPASALFISIGSGNESEVTSVTTYTKEFNVRVVDASGNAVVGAAVAAKLVPVSYSKGSYGVLQNATSWTQNVTVTCPNEDLNFNGVLDSGEDANSSGKLEPRIVASIVSSSGSTDSTGSVALRVNFAKSFARWQRYLIEVSTSVQGTEKTATFDFLFPGVSTDFTDVNVSPPNIRSPYGQSASCSDPN